MGLDRQRLGFTGRVTLFRCYSFGKEMPRNNQMNLSKWDTAEVGWLFQPTKKRGVAMRGERVAEEEGETE